MLCCRLETQFTNNFFFSQVNSWCLLSHFWTLTCAPAPVYLCFSPIPVFYRCESQTGIVWAMFTVVVDRKSCEVSQNPKDMPGMENKQQMLQCHRTKVERHNPSIPVRCILLPCIVLVSRSVLGSAAVFSSSWSFLPKWDSVKDSCWLAH